MPLPKSLTKCKAPMEKYDGTNVHVLARCKLKRGHRGPHRAVFDGAVFRWSTTSSGVGLEAIENPEVTLRSETEEHEGSGVSRVKIYMNYRDPPRSQLEAFLDICGDLMGDDPAGLLERTRLEEFYFGPDRCDPMAVPAIAAWYESLDRGEPDFDACYRSERAVANGWFCWLQSRPFAARYLERVASCPPCSILDAGAGIGMMAVELSEELDVPAYVTNAPGSTHAEVARRVIEAAGVKVGVLEPGSEVESDLLVVLEYLEHFEEPVRELERLVDRVDPADVLMANSFGVLAPGHFREFRVDGDLLGPRATSSAVSRFMKSRGFERDRGIRAWNGKPQLWTRE